MLDFLVEDGREKVQAIFDFVLHMLDNVRSCAYHSVSPLAVLLRE